MTVLIILVVIVVLVAGISLALGRATYEVDSARDTEFLELEGDWVRYDVMGGGPPVVLVHGWLSSSAVWDQLARRLAQRFTVYTLDLTGFGESDKPMSGYGIRYGSRLLYAFCAHFGLTHASVIGHDLGGTMAMKLASDHPDVVSRIVLVATPANEEQIDLPTPLWAATLPVVGPIVYALGRAIRPLRSMWMKPFVLEPEDVTEEMLEDAASSTPAAMSQSLSVGRREIGGGRLARQSRVVRVPVMIITGEEDQIVDPQAAGVWARSLEQTEVCLMDECGHMPMIERPVEFNAQILAFLTGDARYLEQARIEHDQDYETADSANHSNTDEIDTMEVDIHPEEGEAPAFAEHVEPEDERLEDERPEDDEPEIERYGDTGVGDEPRWTGRLSRQETTSEDDDAHEPTESLRGESDEDDHVIRRLGDRFSGRSSRSRRSTRSERAERRRLREEEAEEDDETTDLSRFATGMPDPEVEEPKDDQPASDFYTPGEPEGSGTPKPPPIEKSETDDVPEAREEPTPRRESPRRRPRREGRAGDVPEVPRDLFDWGDSLDDFEPVRRRPRPDKSEEEVRRDEKPGDEEGSHDPSDNPFRS